MSFGEVMKRIVSSKKTVLAMVPIAASVGATFFGYDPTEGLTLIVNSVFSILVVVQGFLDFKWGSPSDHTGGSG